MGVGVGVGGWVAATEEETVGVQAGGGCLRECVSVRARAPRPAARRGLPRLYE